MSKRLADEHRSELAACAKSLWGRVYASAMLVTCGDHALAQDVTQLAGVSENRGMSGLFPLVS